MIGIELLRADSFFSRRGISIRLNKFVVRFFVFREILVWLRKDVAVAFSIRFLINREDRYISLLECHVHVIYGSSKRIIDRTKLGNARR